MPTRSYLPLILSFFFGAMISTSVAFATEVEIEDPKNTLQSFPFPGGPVAFDKAFQCDKSVSFFTKTGQCKIHCEFGLCEQQCGWAEMVEAQFQPSECSAEQVMIYSSLGHAITATAEDYKTATNSIALTILKFTSSFYEHIDKIRIDGIFFGTRKGLIENGKLRPVSLTSIVLSVFPDRNQAQAASLQLHLDLSQSGLEQLMCISEDGICDPKQHYLMKRKGLVNATF